MQVATELPERIYGLTVADDRRTVRPHEEIRLCFRVRNARTAATPAAYARFTIPAGWTASDPLEYELPPLDAGAEHAIEVRLCAPAADDGPAGAFQVAVALPDGTLGSNVVRIAVVGRARFDRTRTSLAILPGDEPRTIRALITAVNEGDAVARDVRVAIPAPPGFTACDADPAHGPHALAPGESATYAAVFRACTPASAVVRIDDAWIAFEGGCDALTTTEPLVLAACLRPPIASLVHTATRLDVAIRIANAGALAARDVAVRVTVPPGWRAVRGAVALDGAPAAAVVRGDALHVTLPLVAAGGAVELHLLAYARTAHAAGFLSVACGEHEVAAEIPAALRRSVQLDPCAERAWTSGGTPVAVAARVWNDGETDESITLAADGAPVARLVLRAGAAADAAFAVAGPATLEARADDGLVLATCALAMRVAVPAEPASAVHDADTEPALTVRWEVAEHAAAGTAFDVALRCRVARDLAVCRVRPKHAGARYVPGSTRVNDHAVVDGAGEPPLFSAAGLGLYGVAAGSELVLAWRLVADGSGDVVLDACADADGVPLAWGTQRVAVAAPAPFALRPDGLAFHLDAPTVPAPTPLALPPRIPASAAAAPVVAFGLLLDTSRRTTIARMLAGIRGTTIAAHLPLLAALFPDAVEADAQLADALALAGERVRSIYERLFVKLRIPGYDVGPYDLEDAATRSALAALLDGAAHAPAATAPPGAELHVALDRATLVAARVRLERAPLGGADAVAAAALFLPRAGDDAGAQSLTGYAALLVREIDAARSLAHEAFAAYLTMHAIDGLERARTAALAALAPSAGPA